MRYPILLDYTPTKAARLKKFCRLTDTTIKDFVSTAIENEIAYQLEQMEAGKRGAVEKLLR